MEAIGSMIMRSKKDQPIDESESDPRQDWLYIDISLPAYAGRAPIDVAENTPPPRLLRTHLSYELLPQSAIASKSKVYYSHANSFTGFFYNNYASIHSSEDHFHIL